MASEVTLPTPETVGNTGSDDCIGSRGDSAGEVASSSIACIGSISAATVCCLSLQLYWKRDSGFFCEFCKISKNTFS